MSAAINLAIVDDHQLFRRGIVSLLNRFKRFNILFEAENGQELIKGISGQKPEVVLLDLQMPVMDGIKTAEYMKEHYPEIKIIVLSMYHDDDTIVALLKKGVSGFLQKNDSLETILEAIEEVSHTGYFFTEEMSKIMVKGLIEAKRIKPNFGFTPLSSREIEVIRLMSKEFKNSEIAAKLFINVRTVDRHKENIMRKINAKNSIGVIMYAVKNNLLE